MSQPRRDTARTPELPRVHLDTRMPPAPAPGGRVIAVGAPRPRERSASFLVGAFVLGVITVTFLLWRWARTHRRG